MNHQISIYLFIPIFDTFVAMKLWLRSGRVTCVECNFSPSAVHTPMHFVEFHSSLLIFYDRMWRYLWNLYLQTSMNDKPICCFRIQLMASHARTQWCANSWSSPGPGVRHFFFFIDCNKSTWWNRIPRSKLNNGIYIASTVMQMHHEKLIRTRKPPGKMKFMCSHVGSTVCEQYLSMTINRAHWFACAVPALQQINTKKKPEQNRNNSWDWDTHTTHKRM